MKYKWLIGLFVVTYINAYTQDTTTILIKSSQKPFVFRYQPQLNWYAIFQSKQCDSITLQRNYSAQGELFPRQVQVQFPITTEIKELNSCLAKRNPSDTSLPDCAKGSFYIIGTKHKLKTGVYTNNTLAYDAGYLPFRNSIRIGSSFNLENELHHSSLYAVGEIYTTRSGGPWLMSNYSLHYSGAARKVSGEYQFCFDEEIWKSSDTAMQVNEVPSVVWFGLLDYDEFPDFIIEKGSRKRRHFELVLSTGFYKKENE